MFKFVKQIFVSAMMFFRCNVSSVNSLNAVPKCISMNNQECKVKPEIININSNESLFYPCSIKVKNAVTVVIILMTHIQNYAFLMLLKT